MSGISTCFMIATIMSLKTLHCTNVTKMEPFVVNGDFAKIKKFPHAVFIYSNCGGLWICGSSILNQKILLTAAHCLHKCRKRGSIGAFAGHRNIKKSIAIRMVEKTLMHEHYHHKSIRNDIGLVLLQNDLPLGRKIKRVIINKQNNIGKRALIAGWGFIDDEERQGTELLMWTDVKVRSESTCRKITKLRPGTMCAGSFNKYDGRPSPPGDSSTTTLYKISGDIRAGMEDKKVTVMVLINFSNAFNVVRGDSGSALITNDFHQIGLVSYRMDPFPALIIYTNISYYYNWIRNNSRALYCGKIETSRLIT